MIDRIFFDALRLPARFISARRGSACSSRWSAYAAGVWPDSWAVDPLRKSFPSTSFVQQGILALVLFSLLFLFIGCTRHPGASNDGNQEFSGEAVPCQECASGGDMKIRVEDSTIWLETVPGFRRNNMPRLLGVLPTLQIEARTTQNCKFCQAFSADGLDFDFGSRQDSLLRTLDSNIHPLLMVPGLQVPEADSTQWNIYMDSLAAQTFLDGKTIMDFQPWIDRGNQRIVQERRLSPGLRTWLSRIAARWSVNGLVVPAHLRVE
ncbi:MAG TPA: hypothetical protein VLM37_08510, partial [Fibrobacteraceae bacterium]|nr:hypothetical protein [Fibrobacteraceae bacterium]